MPNNISFEEILNALPQTDKRTEPEVIQARKKHARSYMPWTNEEDYLLYLMHTKRENSIFQISTILKRSENAIHLRLENDSFIQACGVFALDETESFIENETFTIPETESFPDTHYSSSINKEIKQSKNIPKVKEILKADESIRVLAYWRSSLADTEKMGLDAKKMHDGEQFSLDAFKTGQLSSIQVSRLFKDIERAANLKEQEKNKFKKEPLKKEPIDIKQIQVIIAPYTAIAEYDHGKKINMGKSPTEVFPLWIVANLNKNGTLTPVEEEIYPWIDRRCLTPNEDERSSGYPLIGDVSEVDHFYAQENALFEDGNLTWSKLFGYAESLFSSLVKNNNSVFENYNYSLSHTGYILPENDVKDATRNIISTYDEYLFEKNKVLPPLLRHFCSLAESKHVKDKNESTLFLESKNHLGQMEQKFALSASQSNSLSYLFDPHENDLFTIHGPPGTGKTTLILSIIGTSWVKAAISKGYSL